MDLEKIFADAPPGFARYGVVGHPVSHSLSPALHGASLRHFRLKAVYRAIPVPPDQWPDFAMQARRLPLAGFNVTVPHKEKVRHETGYADGDQAAFLTKAANTVLWRDNEWKGFNTDAEGFHEDLKAHGIETGGRRIAVLGAGGSARAVLTALKLWGPAPRRVVIINRSLERGRWLLDDLEKVPGAHAFAAEAAATDAARRDAVAFADLLINCTSVGLAPGGRHVIDFQWLPSRGDVYDLIYHRETELMAAARQRGARAVGGLGMLVRQAAKSFKIWFGVEPPLDLMFSAAQDQLARQRRQL
jgi:shikimate dehydrogenase